MSGPALHVEEAGDPAAPAIVLLHAIATTSAMWRPQARQLAQRFRVLAIDLPGHGRSRSAPLPGDMQGYADAVMATLTVMGVRQAAIAGLSLGSMVAQRIASSAPERVTRLVLSNGVAAVTPPVSAAWAERIAAAERSGMTSQVEPTLQRWFTPAFRDSEGALMDEIAGWIAATPLPGYVAAGRAIAALDQLDALRAITAPTLVLAGDHDTAAPPLAVRAVAEAIPHARFASLPAGHLMNLELADAYTALVEGFLHDTTSSTEQP